MSTILIIDDDDITRLYLGKILINAGHTVYETDSGQNGLEQISTGQIDLIITDIFMPNMDGFELLNALSRSHPSSKVIAMSGGRSSMSKKLTFKAAEKFGAIAFLGKPFKLSHVIKTVSHALLLQHPHSLQKKGKRPWHTS